MSSGERRKSARISELDARRAQQFKKPYKANGNLGTGQGSFKRKKGRKIIKKRPMENLVNNTIENHVQEAGTSSNGYHHSNTAEAEIPERTKLKLLLSALQGRDSNNFFAEPVDEEEVDFYYEVIKEPMDFCTIESKINGGSYVNLEEFERDVYLVFSNAMYFNSSDTVYYKEAHSLKKLADDLFRVIKTDPEKLESKVSCLKPKRGRPSKADVSVSKSNFPNKKDCTPQIYEQFVEKHVDFIPEAALNEQLLSTLWKNSKSPVHVNQGNFGYGESSVQFGEGLGPTSSMVSKQKIKECDAARQNVASVSRLQALKCQVPALSFQKGDNSSHSSNFFGNSVGHQTVSYQNRENECGTSNGNNVANNMNACGSLNGVIDQVNYTQEKLGDLQGKMNLSASKRFDVANTAFWDNMEKQSLAVQLGVSLPGQSSANRDWYPSSTLDTNNQPVKFTNMMLDASHVQKAPGASSGLRMQDGLYLGKGLDVGWENTNKQSVEVQLGASASLARTASANENLYSSPWDTNKQPDKFHLKNMMLDTINMDKHVQTDQGTYSESRVQDGVSLGKELNVGWENMNQRRTGIQLGSSFPRTSSADENLFSSATRNTNSQPGKCPLTNMMLDAINTGKHVQTTPVALSGLRMQDGIHLSNTFRENMDKPDIWVQLGGSVTRAASANRNLYSSATWDTKYQPGERQSGNVMLDAINVDKHFQTAQMASSGSRMLDNVNWSKGLHIGTAFGDNVGKQSPGTELGASLSRNASVDTNLYSSSIWNTNNQPDKYQSTNMMPDAINMGKHVQTAFGASSVLKTQDRDKDALSHAWQWPSRELSRSQAIGSMQRAEGTYGGGVHVAANRGDGLSSNGSLEQGSKVFNWFKPKESEPEPPLKIDQAVADKNDQEPSLEQRVFNWLGPRELEQRARDFNWFKPKQLGLAPVLDRSSQQQSGTIEDLLGQAGPSQWHGWNSPDTDGQLQMTINANEDGENQPSSYGETHTAAGGLPELAIHPNNWAL